jgi:hypothetical protein
LLVKLSLRCANPTKNFLLKTQQRVFVIPVSPLPYVY